MTTTRNRKPRPKKAARHIVELAVKCPTCGAVPSQICLRNGAEINFTHRARRAAYESLDADRARTTPQPTLPRAPWAR
mgnify:CR=1 FL=1